MGLLVLLQALIAVAGSRVSDGVEAGRVESDHAEHGQGQDEAGGRHRIHDVQDQLVEISALLILGDEVRRACDLQAQAVVAQDDEADDGGAHAENIAAQDRLLDGSAAADVADEERRRDAPYHPVSPVVNGPVLGEVVGAGRIRVGAQLNEVLEHLSKALEAVLDDEAALSSDHQHEQQQAKKEINTQLCQEADALEPVQYSISIYRAGDQQDNDRDSRAADADIEQFDDDTRHQGRRHRECGGRSCQQREQGKKIDDSSQQSVGVLLADHGLAGLAVSLPGALAHMQHEAEGHRQHQVEGPGNEAPVEQREYSCPLSDGSHLRDVRVCGIHDPLRKGVEQDVRRQSAGEHHGSPGKEVVLRLLIRLSQNDVPVLGKRKEDRYQKHAHTDHKIIESHGISEEEADLGNNSVRLLREHKQINRQCHDQNERHQCDHPVDPLAVCSYHIIAHD